MPGIHKVGKYYRQRMAAPAKFIKGSFRTLKRGSHRIIVGCPKSCPRKNKPCPRGRTSGRCPRGMRVQSILHPLSEGYKMAKRVRDRHLQ